MIRNSDGSMRYLKYEWQDINWQDVFDILNISLQRLYDNSINYWSSEQVKDIRDLLQILCDDPRKIREFDNGGTDKFQIRDVEKAKSLQSDAEKLLTFFNEYVALGVRIYVS